MTSLAHTPEAAPSDLEAVLQAGLDAGLTGVALRVERGDEILFDGAAGFASVERGTLLTPADRIRIASVTKAFTAVVVMQLVEEGALALDDTVGQRLEDPVVGRIPNVDRMTVRQLLNHTGGVYDYFDEDSPFWSDAYFGDGVDWTRVWTPDELLG
jgi:D-alanyl-D-alanine carboxypeptidase